MNSSAIQVEREHFENDPGMGQAVDEGLDEVWKIGEVQRRHRHLQGIKDQKGVEDDHEETQAAHDHETAVFGESESANALYEFRVAKQAIEIHGECFSLTQNGRTLH